jgi:hypothetical protein
VDLGEVGFAGLGRGDVEDLACFVEGEAGGGEGGGGGAVALVCGGEFLIVLLGVVLKRFQGGGAHTCDAEACLYASANARPKTRAPVKTTCVIMRWACGVVSMRDDVGIYGESIP